MVKTASSKKQTGIFLPLLLCLVSELPVTICNKYRKSYERECISGLMSMSIVLKVIKI